MRILYFFEGILEYFKKIQDTRIQCILVCIVVCILKRNRSQRKIRETRVQRAVSRIPQRIHFQNTSGYSILTKYSAIRLEYECIPVSHYFGARSTWPTWLTLEIPLESSARQSEYCQDTGQDTVSCYISEYSQNTVRIPESSVSHIEIPYSDCISNVFQVVNQNTPKYVTIQITSQNTVFRSEYASGYSILF